MNGPGLGELAQRWGVQNGYHDVSGHWHEAHPEALRDVLVELGAPISFSDNQNEINGAIEAHQHLLVRQGVEPVLVVNADQPLGFVLWLAETAARRAVVTVELVCEDTSTFSQQVSVEDFSPFTHATLAGTTYTARYISTGIQGLPFGYHEAYIQVAARSFNPLILAPPPQLPGFDTPRPWGVFAPLYALPPQDVPGSSHLGIANFGHLDRMAAAFQPFGAKLVSTLPLLATYLSDPFEPSPYSPVSRRWWSELYLNPAELPGLATAPHTREFLALDSSQQSIQKLGQQPLVPYAQVASTLHEVVAHLVGEAVLPGSPTYQALETFRQNNPEVAEYAWFRAAVEEHGVHAARKNWLKLRVNQASVTKHEYFQYAANFQLGELAKSLQRRGQMLALDLPLGSNPDGYDVCRDPTSYAQVATGAPPDALFSGGQNWGFPPPHPIRARQNRYGEFIAALRHHFRYAGLLRIDHLMSLERLWWVPSGFDAKTGIYVRYPTHELMAIVAIEAWRTNSVVVGENLGTVSNEINEVMRSWGMLGMYELQFEPAFAHQHGFLRQPPTNAVASLNTHDMPTFAGWWKGNDIKTMEQLEFVSKDEATAAQAVRGSEREALRASLETALARPVEAKASDALAASLEWLGASQAEVVTVNVEDLWGEDQPQNVPGTHREVPNWCRRFNTNPHMALSTQPTQTVLARLDRSRRGAISEVSGD